jgi:hypothetical protein
MLGGCGVTTEQIEHVFREWWSESFPMAPPNSRTIQTHTAFAEYTLQMASTLQEYNDCSV